MDILSRHIVRHAEQLAQEVAARAVVVYADAIGGADELRQVLQAVTFPTILVSRSTEAVGMAGFESHAWVRVPNVHMTRAGQVKSALLVCLARGLLQKGDRVICLIGIDGSPAIDTLLVLNLGTEPELFSFAAAPDFVGDVAPEVFERALTLATQLAVEAGRAPGRGPVRPGRQRARPFPVPRPGAQPVPRPPGGGAQSARPGPGARALLY
jgi:hypothetical protein